MKELERFLSTVQLPGKLLFAKVWGSRSHNTQIETSDWDFCGVYAAPTKQILGLDQPPESVVRDKGDSISSTEDPRPDYQFHEVSKFCQLLLKGNPGILEMLFTDRLCITTPEWNELQTHRRNFISQRVISQYLGYAQGQIDRMNKGVYLHTKSGKQNEKWTYHIYRLVTDALRIASGLDPEVWKIGVELDYLLTIRKGDPEVLQAALRDAESTIATIKGMNLSHLPEQGDRELLSDWLIHLRLEDLVNT